jgi:hypothetical protein
VLRRKNTGGESQSAGPSRSFDSGEAACCAVGEAGADADERIAEMSLTHPQTEHAHPHELAVQPLFGLEGTTIPRHTLPEEQLSPDVAYQIIHDELMLDGNARLNVATFVTPGWSPRLKG